MLHRVIFSHPLYKKRLQKSPYPGKPFAIIIESVLFTKSSTILKVRHYNILLNTWGGVKKYPSPDSTNLAMMKWTPKEITDES
jgi:hypothetical protein